MVRNETFSKSWIILISAITFQIHSDKYKCLSTNIYKSLSTMTISSESRYLSETLYNCLD